MENGNRVIIKSWHDLTRDELDEMNESHAREWNISSMNPDYHAENIFFLLKDSEKNILAQGQLVPIKGVVFNGETFDIFGIGGIIANKKGEGYGRQIMNAIKDYLTSHNTTGVGFTGFSGFYEKCGFNVDRDAIKRFIYMTDGKEVVNTESDRVCFLDAEDNFMEKVIQNQHELVYLPRTPDW